MCYLEWKIGWHDIASVLLTPTIHLMQWAKGQGTPHTSYSNVSACKIISPPPQKKNKYFNVILRIKSWNRIKNSWVNIWIKIHKRKKLLTQLKDIQYTYFTKSFSYDNYDSTPMLLKWPITCTITIEQKIEQKMQKCMQFQKNFFNWAYSADKLSK